MHFHGLLTEADKKRHIPHTFDVPAGTTRIDIDLSYSPRFVGRHLGCNLLTLTIFDPDSARGTGHKHNEIQHVTISAAEATPGYTPGAIQPGRWTVYLDSHMILPDEPLKYDLHIHLSDEPIIQAAPVWAKGRTAPRGAGWYRGDLHGHTFHSDGGWDVPDLVQWARDYKLDFVTLTDHNTASGLAQMESLSADDLLTMGGVELTTFYGHCLALGVRQWMEWRVQIGVTMADLAARVVEAGGLYIIAHPKAVGDPICTGCAWLYDDMMPGSARVIEVWNSSVDGVSNNDDAVLLWYSWLNEGYRMTATSGTDIHDANWPEARLGFNVVYAQELSEGAILDAVRQGHAYISDGPALDLTARCESVAGAMMGDTLPNEAAEILLTWRNCKPDDQIRVIVNGEAISRQAAGESGEMRWQLSPEQARWCTVEVRDAAGILRAITNPIFFTGEWR